MRIGVTIPVVHPGRGASFFSLIDLVKGRILGLAREVSCLTAAETF
jgi:hypothetical protein